MKKITFYKSMIGGKFEQAQGYYYKAKNGLEFAIHGGNKIGCDWCVTELTTGLSCSTLGGRTIKIAVEQVEQISKSVAYALAHIDHSMFIEQIAKLQATA